MAPPKKPLHERLREKVPEAIRKRIPETIKKRLRPSAPAAEEVPPAPAPALEPEPAFEPSGPMSTQEMHEWIRKYSPRPEAPTAPAEPSPHPQPLPRELLHPELGVVMFNPSLDQKEVEFSSHDLSGHVIPIASAKPQNDRRSKKPFTTDVRIPDGTTGRVVGVDTETGQGNPIIFVQGVGTFTYDRRDVAPLLGEDERVFGDLDLEAGAVTVTARDVVAAPGGFVFAWHCPSPPDILEWQPTTQEDLEEYGDILDYIDRHSTIIDPEDLFAAVRGGEKQVLDDLMYGSVYDEDAPIANDQTISWYKSNYPDGTPVYYEPAGYRGPKCGRSAAVTVTARDVVAFTGDQRDWEPGARALHGSGETVRILEKQSRPGGISVYQAEFLTGGRKGQRIIVTPSALRPESSPWNQSKKTGSSPTWFFLRDTDDPQRDLARGFSCNVNAWVQSYDEAEDARQMNGVGSEPRQDPHGGLWCWDPEAGLSAFAVDGEPRLNHARRAIASYANGDVAVFTSSDYDLGAGADGEDIFRGGRFLGFVNPDTVTYDELVRLAGSKTAVVVTANDLPAKRRLLWRGLALTIEAPGGDVRNPNSKHPQKVPADFGGIGFIEGLEADDGDSLDVIVGPGNPEEGDVYLAIQTKPDREGTFIQWKVLLGFEDEATAEAGFLEFWPEKMFGGITAIPQEEFREIMLPRIIVDEDDLEAAEDALTVTAADLVTAAPRKPKAPAAKAPSGLVALHNLNESNLLHAQEMGGLIAPSLAITKASQGFENFGEITLVAPMSLVDPKTTPVFDADIYSARYPDVRFKTNEKEISKFRKTHEDQLRRTDSYFDDMTDVIKEHGYEGVMNRPSSISGLQLAFLEKVKGIEVPTPTKNKPVEYEWVQTPTMQKFLTERGVNPNARPPGWRDDEEESTDTYYKDLSDAARASIHEFWSQPRGTIKERTRNRLRDDEISYYFDENGLLHYSKFDKVFKSHDNIGKTETDKSAFQEQLNALIKPYEAEFKAWAREQLAPTQGDRYLPTGDPHVRGSYRQLPYTPENVLKLMTKNKIKGAESFNYGLGSLRSLGANRFRSLEQMESMADRIVSREEFDGLKEANQNRFFELLKQLRPYHAASDSFQFPDTLMLSIGESYTRGRSLVNELKRDGFEDVPPELVEEIAKFARDLVNMPTEYFEAKPQRLVGLNEFVGAVVPKDASPQVLEVLKANGLAVEFYNKEKPQTRVKAISKLQGKAKPKKAAAEPITVTAVDVQAAALDIPPKMFEQAKQTLIEAYRRFARARLQEGLDRREKHHQGLPETIKDATEWMTHIGETLAVMQPGQLEEIPMPALGAASPETTLGLWRRPDYASSPGLYNVMMGSEENGFDATKAMSLEDAVNKAKSLIFKRIKEAQAVLRAYDSIGQWDQRSNFLKDLGDDQRRLMSLENEPTEINIPVDITNWRYADQVDPKKLPSHIILRLDPNDRAPGLWSDSKLTLSLGFKFRGVPEDEQEYHEAMAFYVGALEHEFGHVAQSLLERGKGLENDGAGVPSGAKPSPPPGTDAFREWWRNHERRPHPQRAVEFYPNILSEVQEFEQSVGSNDLSPAERREHARGWVSSRPRFKSVRETSEKRWEKMVTEFLRLVDPEAQAKAGALTVTAADLEDEDDEPPMILQHKVRMDLEHLRDEKSKKEREKAKANILANGFNLNLFGKSMKRFYGQPDPGPRGVSFTTVDDPDHLRENEVAVYSTGRFRNPLRVPIDDKAQLAERFHAKNSTQLRRALIKAGHDAVFVTTGDDILEVIALHPNRLTHHKSYQSAWLSTLGKRSGVLVVDAASLDRDEADTDELRSLQGGVVVHAGQHDSSVGPPPSGRSDLSPRRAALRLYHGTTKERAAQIRANGFSLDQAGERQRGFHGADAPDPRGVFLTSDERRAEWYAGSGGDVVEVDVDGQILDHAAWRDVLDAAMTELDIQPFDGRHQQAYDLAAQNVLKQGAVGVWEFERAPEAIIFDLGALRVVSDRVAVTAADLASPRIIDTATAPEDTNFGGAAFLEGGELVGYHITDNPEAIRGLVDAGQLVRAEDESRELGAGLYISATPQFWVGRSTNKWDFLKQLTEAERRALANTIRQDERGWYGLSQGEKQRALMYLERWEVDPDTYIVFLAGQPYNIAFWKPEYLAKAGLDADRLAKTPMMVEVRARGRFVELDSSYADTSAYRSTCDGAFTRAGITRAPECVIWNPAAITRIGPPQKAARNAAAGTLGSQIMALRPALAQAAQSVIDAWQPDPEEGDPELGFGGICDQVARAMSEVLSGLDANITDGGQPGDDHAYLIVYNDTEAYEVDISPSVYETGGGYSWQKIQGALVDPEDVYVGSINRADLGDLDFYGDHTRTARHQPDKAPGENVGVFLPVPKEIEWPAGREGEDDSPPHLTVLYVGPIEDDQKQRFLEIVRSVSEAHGPLEMEFKPGVDFFENHKGQTIAYKGLTPESEDSLRALHEDLRRDLTSAGFGVKHHDGFVAHATLKYFPSTSVLEVESRKRNVEIGRYLSPCVARLTKGESIIEITAVDLHGLEAGASQNLPDLTSGHAHLVSDLTNGQPFGSKAGDVIETDVSGGGLNPVISRKGGSGSSRNAFRPESTDQASDNDVSGVVLLYGHSDNDPSVVSKSLVLARITFTASGAVMPSPVQLDRDFPDGFGEVYVPSTEWKVEREINAVLSKPLNEAYFDGRHGSASACLSDLGVPLLRAFKAGARFVALPLETLGDVCGGSSGGLGDIKNAQARVVQAQDFVEVDWIKAHLTILASSEPEVKTYISPKGESYDGPVPEGSWLADEIEIWGWPEDIASALGEESMAKEAARTTEGVRLGGRHWLLRLARRLADKAEDAEPLVVTAEEIMAATASPFDEVERYVDTGAYFTFSDVPKFWARPTYGYSSTPMGFYGYPLTRALFDAWKWEKSLDVAFATDRDWVLVWKFGDDVKTMDVAQKMKMPPDLRNVIEEAFEAGDEALRERIIALAPESEAMQEFRFESEDELEKLSEGLEAEGLSDIRLQIFNHILATSYGEHIETIADWIDNRLRDAHHRGGTTAQVYKALWIASGLDVAKWARRLQDEFGIEGVTDLQGTGSIHPNEPAQAVAIDPRAVEPLTVVRNPTSRGTREDKTQRRDVKQEQWKTLEAIRAGKPVNLLEALFAHPNWGYSTRDLLKKLSDAELAQAAKHPSANVQRDVQNEQTERQNIGVWKTPAGQQAIAVLNTEGVSDEEALRALAPFTNEQIFELKLMTGGSPVRALLVRLREQLEGREAAKGPITVISADLAPLTITADDLGGLEKTAKGRTRKRREKRRRMYLPAYYRKPGESVAFTAAYGIEGREQVTLRPDAKILNLTEESLRQRTASKDDQALVEAVKSQAASIERLTELVERLMALNTSGYDAVKTEDRLIILNPKAVEAAPQRAHWLSPRPNKRSPA